MNNEEKKILSLKEMQDMFSDYVFNKLNDKDRQRFEGSLTDYQEIQSDLEQVSSVFSSISPSKIEKKLSGYTRNLSVKVNQRLAENNHAIYKLQRFYKYLIPASGLALILLVVSYFNIDKTNQFENSKEITHSQTLFTGITATDIDSLYEDEKLSVDYLVQIEKFEPSPLNQTDVLAKLDNYDNEYSLNEVYNDILSEQILQDGINLSKFGSNNQYDLFNNIEYFEEEEIENILKEIENADFNT